MKFKCHFSADGIHLFDRNSGHNILLDEITPKKEKYSLAPKYISIALTNRCDLSCHYCYAPKNKSEIDLEILKKWLSCFDENGALGVGFGGGEPFLYSNMFNVCRFVRNNTTLALSATTHGHLLDEKKIDQYKDYFNFLRISMDGYGSNYENNRKRSFSDLLKNLELIGKNIKFGINVVVNKDTVADLDNISNLAEELGASELLLLPQISTINSRGIDEKTRGVLHRWVIGYKGSVRLAINKSESMGLPVCHFNSACDNDYAHITADGLFKKNSFSMTGIDLYENDLLDILNMR